jgi:plasmid maintenance system antidote protein VapI
MLMHNPPHPGEVLRDVCLESLGLSVTAAAKALGVSRKTLSALLNGGRLEIAQALAAHEPPRTTKLYDRTADAITLQEVERIASAI